MAPKAHASHKEHGRKSVIKSYAVNENDHVLVLKHFGTVTFLALVSLPSTLDALCVLENIARTPGGHPRGKAT